MWMSDLQHKGLDISRGSSVSDTPDSKGCGVEVVEEEPASRVIQVLELILSYMEEF